MTHPAELFALLKMRAALAALGKPIAVASLDHLVATSAHNFFRRITQQGFRSLVPGDDAMLRVHGKHAVGSVGKLVEELGDWLGAVLRQARGGLPYISPLRRRLYAYKKPRMQSLSFRRLNATQSSIFLLTGNTPVEPQIGSARRKSMTVRATSW